MLEIKEDIREECARVGDVTNVVLFDKEPDGVASVRFANPEDAKACVRVCHFPLPNFLLLCFKFLLASLLASCPIRFPNTHFTPSHSLDSS